MLTPAFPADGAGVAAVVREEQRVELQASGGLVELANRRISRSRTALFMPVEGLLRAAVRRMVLACALLWPGVWIGFVAEPGLLTPRPVDSSRT